MKSRPTEPNPIKKAAQEYKHDDRPVAVQVASKCHRYIPMPRLYGLCKLCGENGRVYITSCCLEHSIIKCPDYKEKA